MLSEWSKALDEGLKARLDQVADLNWAYRQDPHADGSPLAEARREMRRAAHRLSAAIANYRDLIR